MQSTPKLHHLFHVVNKVSVPNLVQIGPLGGAIQRKISNLMKANHISMKLTFSPWSFRVDLGGLHWAWGMSCVGRLNTRYNPYEH